MKQAAEKHPPGPHGELRDRAPVAGRDFNKAAGHRRVGWLDNCVPIVRGGCSGWGWEGKAGLALRCCACRCL